MNPKRTYGRTSAILYIYIYIARLIIEQPREWLASLADNISNFQLYRLESVSLASLARQLQNGSHYKAS